MEHFLLKIGESGMHEPSVSEFAFQNGSALHYMVWIDEKVKEGALERLADRPRARCGTVPLSVYEVLKRDLEEKERVLVDL